MTSPAYDERLLADVGRPLVGIDVDGVLNALGDDLDPELYRTHRVLLYRIQLRADLLAVVQPLLTKWRREDTLVVHCGRACSDARRS